MERERESRNRNSVGERNSRDEGLWPPEQNDKIKGIDVENEKE